MIFFPVFAVLLQLKASLIQVEIAETEEARRQGLMGRSHLAEGEGMLFVFPSPQILTFWMKGTEIPLSIAFFNEKRQCIHLEEMKPGIGLPDSQLPFYSSEGVALYALEMAPGWFQQHAVQCGDSFEFKE